MKDMFDHLPITHLQYYQLFSRKHTPTVWLALILLIHSLNFDPSPKKALSLNLIPRCTDSTLGGSASTAGLHNLKGYLG